MARGLNCRYGISTIEEGAREGMPRKRSDFICPVCGSQGFLTRRTKNGPILGARTYFYVVHAFKNLETGEWVRKWHYVGTDHVLKVEPTVKPAKAWQG
ncbi:MAG: hypothetical protein QXT26_04060 [Thermoproteota archaeon]